MNVLNDDDSSEEHPPAPGGCKFEESEQVEVATGEEEADSNAVLLPVWPELVVVGRLLQDPESGRPTWMFWLMQLLCVAIGVSTTPLLAYGTAEATGMSSPNGLLWIASAAIGLGMCSLSLPVYSAMVALRPGGPLEMLGAGNTATSAAEALRLSRIRFYNFSMAISMGIIGIGLWLIPLLRDPAPPLLVSLFLVPQGLALLLVVPVVIHGFGSSMQIASCLVRDAVTEVCNAAGRDGTVCENEDSQRTSTWQSSVAQPALALEKAMNVLSSVWAVGLAGNAVCMWSVSVGFLVHAANGPACRGLDETRDMPTNTTRNICFAMAAILLPVPFMLAYDVCHTSSHCDYLMEALNRERIRRGPGDHADIAWLETSLSNLNLKQGLGFLVGGRHGMVLDMSRLQRFFVGMYSVFTFVVSTMMSMDTPDVGMPVTSTDAGSA